MAFRVRRENLSSSVIRNPPNLPIPMTVGKINWSISFQGFPSGSIEYESISESDINKFKLAYDPKTGDKKVVIYGVSYLVESYSETRTSYIWKNRVRFGVYNVSISLKSVIEEKVSQKIKVFNILPYGSRYITLAQLASGAKIDYIGPNTQIAIPVNAERNYALSIDDVLSGLAIANNCFISYSSGKVELINFNQSKTWNFAAQEIMSDGANTLRRNINGIKNGILTWGNQDKEDEQIPNSPPQIPYVRKEPVKEVIVEESEDFESPPAETTVIKGLDSTSDYSSPIKNRKKTTIVNGVTIKEVIEIAKFEYTAEDISVGDAFMFSTEPEDFWRVVEKQETEYIYERIPGLTLNINALSSDQTGYTSLSPKYLPLILHPDYNSFASFDSNFGGGSFNLNVEYLTKIITKGWKRLRFLKEPTDPNEGTIAYGEDRLTDPFAQAMWDLFQYEQIPSESQTAYKLISAELIYGKNEGNSQPFTVEWKLYNELEPRLKELVDTNAINENELAKLKVGVIFPDPNYVAPMCVVTETKRNSSFAYKLNPESADDDPKPPYVTGEETYDRTDRKVVSPTKYKETISTSSSQNSGFADLTETIIYRDVLGKLPEATTRKLDWEKKDYNDNKRAYSPSLTTTRHYINYNQNSDYVEEGVTKNYPYATSLLEAKTSLETEIKLDVIQKDQCAKTVFSFYPSLRDGDKVKTPSDRYNDKGDWIVVSAAWSLEFKGVNNVYGFYPLCTYEPTSITLGLLPKPEVNVTSKTFTEKLPPNDAGDPQLVVTGGNASVLGEILFNSPNRRRF